MSEERSKESVIERVRKILPRRSGPGCTAEESRAGSQLASRIMAEHNLAGEIERKEGGEQSWLEDDVYETGRWTLEDNLAYGIVTRHFFVEGFFGCGSRRTGERRRHKSRCCGSSASPRTSRRRSGPSTTSWTPSTGCSHEYRGRTGLCGQRRRIYISGVAQRVLQKMEDERKAMEVERDLMGARRAARRPSLLGHPGADPGGVQGGPRR